MFIHKIGPFQPDVLFYTFKLHPFPVSPSHNTQSLQQIANSCFTNRSQMNILTIQGLHKNYRNIKAVSDLNLSIQKGMIFGLLGPNGSGKTTTLGIILGIIQPSRGEFTWFEGQYGKNPRKHLGALLETPNFYPYLSAVENLKIIAQIKGIKAPRINELLELVQLSHRKFSKFKTFSLGMKQRLAIAGAMIGDPEVLIFDEPTNGLDPQGIAEVRNTIMKIAATGKTILMASHILDEVEKICTHVAIIKSGKLLAQGPVGAIINDDQFIEISSNDLEALYSLYQSIPGIHQIEKLEDKLILQTGEELTPETINQLAFEKGVVLNYLFKRKKSLEAEFLEITRDQ